MGTTVTGAIIANRDLIEDLLALTREANSAAITSVIFCDPWTTIHEMTQKRGEPDDFLLDAEEELSSLERLLEVLKKNQAKIPYAEMLQMLQGAVGYAEFLLCYIQDIAERGYMDYELRAELSKRTESVRTNAGQLLKEKL